MKQTTRLFLFAFAALFSMTGYAQKTIKVKTAEQFINAIGPNRTIVIESSKALDISSVIKYYYDLDILTENDTYYYGGELHHHEMPDYSDEEDEEYPFDGVGNYEESDPDDDSSEEELYDDDIKMRALVNYRPENLLVEKYKAKKGDKPNPYVFINPNTDGIELEIRDCDNLTILSKKGKATLLARPRYVNVIYFANCQNLRLENLILGHTLEGACDNGVVKMSNCNGGLIQDCDLFGCGTEGIIVDYCKNFKMLRTDIHDCSYHTLHVVGSETIVFEDCKFYRNKQFDQINCMENEGVNFLRCQFTDLRGPLFNLQSTTHFTNCSFSNCEMSPIQPGLFIQGNAVFTNCKSK